MKYRNFFEQLAQYGHIPISYCKPMRSLYPLLQASISQRLKSPLEDEPIPYSSIPLACLIGEPSKDTINSIQGANLLIIFDALRLISASLKIQFVEQGLNQLSNDDLTDLANFFSSSANFCQLSSDYLIFEGSDQTILNNLIEFLSSFINHIYEEQQLNVLTQSATSYYSHILCLFHPQFEETSCIYEHLPLFFQFLADNQVFLLFQIIAGETDVISQCEEYIKQISLYFAIGNQIDETSQAKYAETSSLLQQYSSFLQSFIKTLQPGQPLVNIRAILITTVASTADSLASELLQSQPTFLSSHFNVENPSAIDVSYTSSILSVLDMILKGCATDDIIQTLLLQINNQTQDPEIKYYCSAATYFKDQQKGYLSLLFSIAPFKFQESQTYYKSITKILMSLFCQAFQSLFDNVDLSQLSEPDRTSLTIAKEVTNDQSSFTLKQAVYSLILSEGLLGNNLDLVRILIAWFYSLGNSLKSLILFLTLEILQFYEANMKLSVQTYNEIVILFTSIFQFDVKSGTIQSINNLLENISKLIPKLKLLLHEISSVFPVSLNKMGSPTDSKEKPLQKYNKSMKTILNVITSSLADFNELKEVLKSKEDLPVDLARSTSLILLQDMYNQLSILQQVIVQQPENFTQVFSEFKIKTFIFSVTSNFVSFSLPEISFKPALKSIEDILTISDTEQLLQQIPNFANELQALNNSLTISSLSHNITASIDFNSKSSIDNALCYISNPKIRSQTLALIEFAKSNGPLITKSTQLSEKLFQAIRELIQYRIDNQNMSDVMPSFDNTITPTEFVAKLTDPQFFKECIELLIGYDIEENKSKIQRYYTYIIPINSLISEYESGKITNEELITKAKDTFGITLPINATLESLKAQAIVIQDGVFDDNKLSSCISRLESSNDIDLEVGKIILDYLSTSTAYNSFNEDAMRAVSDIIKAEQTYKANQTDINKRILIGTIYQLPMDFEPNGTFDDRWKNVIEQSYNQPTNLPKIQNLIANNFIETVIQEINVEVANEIVKPAHIDNLIQDINKLFSNLVKNLISQNSQEVLDQIEEVQNRLCQLKRIDPNMELISIGDHALSVSQQIVQKLISSENPQTFQQNDQNIETPSFFQSIVSSDDQKILKDELSNLKKASTNFREYYGLNPPEASVALMAATNDYLLNIIDQDDLSSSESVHRLIIKGTRDLSFAVKHILDQIKDSPESKNLNQKGITKASKEISRIAQMFFLIKNSNNELNQSLSDIIDSSCKLLKTSIFTLVQALGTKNNVITEITNDLINNIDRLQNETHDMSTNFVQPVASPHSPSQTDFQLSIDNHVIDKFNAQWLVLKRKKEVEFALAEVQRLNSISLSSS